MNKTEKLLAQIKAVEVSPKYDLRRWEMEAIREDAKGDMFTAMSHTFQYGFLKGQRVGKGGK